MILDKLSQNITSFRQKIIIGFLAFFIVVTSFFSGEWNNWLLAIFFVLIFPLVFYTVLLIRDNPVKYKIKFSFKSPYFFLIVFLAVGLVTAFFSVMKYESFQYWSLLLAYALIFWVSSVVFRDFSKLRLVVLAIFITGIIASLVNLFLFISDPNTRAGGALLNANALGSYLLFSVPLGLVLTLGEQKLKTKYLFGIGTVLILISFLLTFSYTGWVSFILPLVIILVVYRKNLFSKKGILIIAGLIIILLAMAVGVRYYSTRDFGQAIALQKTISGSSFSYSFHQRWNFIKSTSHMFIDNPIKGWGLATYQQVYPRYALSVLEQPRYAHNYYLQIAAETGFIGIISLLGFVIVLLINAWRVVKDNFHDLAKRPYLLGLSLGILGSSIHSLFDFGWQFPAVFLLFWISGGLLMGQRQLSLGNAEPSQASEKSGLKVSGTLLILISFLLLARGITLFLSQSAYDHAQARKFKGDFIGSLPYYQQAARFDPSPDKLIGLATSYFENGVDNKERRIEYYNLSDKTFSKDAFWNPHDYFAYHNYGRTLFMRKEYDQAERQYGLAIKYDPVFHPDFQYDLAYLYFAQKKYDLARSIIQPQLDRYQEINVNSNPLLPTQLAYLNLLMGKTYADQGKADQARWYYEQALVRLPNFGLAKDELENLPKK